MRACRAGLVSLLDSNNLQIGYKLGTVCQHQEGLPDSESVPLSVVERRRAASIRPVKIARPFELVFDQVLIRSGDTACLVPAGIEAPEAKALHLLQQRL